MGGQKDLRTKKNWIENQIENLHKMLKKLSNDNFC